MRIAFFDSGIGGLTVLKRARRELPNHDFLYYADTKNVPYGVKPRETVRKHIFEAVDFISRQEVQALVVACNTATSVAIADLRNEYDFPILGMEPAVRPAIIRNHGKKILVAATSLTLREEKLELLIDCLDNHNKTVRMELDALVRYAESFDFDSAGVRAYLRDKLSGLDLENFETIVLGCTHFIYYRKMIQDMVGSGIEIIDGNAGTVSNLKRVLPPGASNGDPRGGDVVFYSSGERDDREREGRLREILDA